MTWVYIGASVRTASPASPELDPDVPKALPSSSRSDPGQFMRLISLSVRLYANMLAGHIDPHVHSLHF
jgi:hypothetical protein